MFLRDLLSWRKPANASDEAANVTLVVVPAEMTAVPVATVEEAPQQGVLHLTTFLHPDGLEPERAEPVADEPEEDVISPRLSVALRRVTALSLPGTQGEVARREAILQRLCIVHDPNEVVVAGKDRTARIVMANRRLISARFCRTGQLDEVFSFDKRRGSRRAGEDFAASLTGFCTDPVDLLVTEKAMSGVFDALAGLAVDDILANPEPKPGKVPARTGKQPAMVE